MNRHDPKTYSNRKTEIHITVRSENRNTVEVNECGGCPPMTSRRPAPGQDDNVLGVGAATPVWSVEDLIEMKRCRCR